MLQQIVSHTPTYVWAILALLIYRGVAASADRTVTLRSLAILPGVMLVLALQDIASKFGLHAMQWTFWLLGAGAGMALAWRRFDPASVAPGAQAGTVVLRGSWQPLALMLAIFCVKYSVAVLLAVQPAARQNDIVVAAICVAFGLANGVFLGRLACVLRCAGRQTAQAPA